MKRKRFSAEALIDNSNWKCLLDGMRRRHGFAASFPLDFGRPEAQKLSIAPSRVI